MSEAELGFDPTMKKKKKKKKIEGLDDDDLDVKPEPVPAETAPQAAPEAAPAVPEVASADTNFDEDLNFDLKKKKKKKAFKPLEDEVPVVPEDASVPESHEPSGTAAASAAADDDLIFDSEMALPEKKKKKKKKEKTLDDLDALDDAEVPQESSAAAEPAEADHGYVYEVLLQRIFAIMKQKNPEMASGEKKHIVLKPPQVHRLGTRRTAFANFTEYCKMLHRPPEHLQNFLIAELGASGSVDGSAALVIRGRFQQKQIENVLRRYIREYVTCHTCKSPETGLVKENQTRLFFLQCESCGSRCSVANIRAGFQAVTGKRAAMRAKTEM